jgi:hypothetical protein
MNGVFGMNGVFANVYRTPHPGRSQGLHLLRNEGHGSSSKAQEAERAATEDELAAAFAEVGAQHGLSPHVYRERCEIARIMARGQHPVCQRHRSG